MLKPEETTDDIKTVNKKGNILLFLTHFLSLVDMADIKMKTALVMWREKGGAILKGWTQGSIYSLMDSFSDLRQPIRAACLTAQPDTDSICGKRKYTKKDTKEERQCGTRVSMFPTAHGQLTGSSRGLINPPAPPFPVSLYRPAARALAFN